MVLKCNECWLFGEYGTQGYPFTDERIKFLKSEDDAAVKQPSLEITPWLSGTQLSHFKQKGQDSFWKLFKAMPWLALPFKDPNHEKLIRIFGYPNKLDDGEEAPMLVVIGRNCEFIDPCGADILMRFGIPAYPFTRNNLAKLETEKAKELKLEML